MTALFRQSRNVFPQRSMRRRAVVVMAGLGLGLLAATAEAQEAKLSPEERAAVCAEARPRLDEWLAQHPVTDGTVVVAIWKEVFCPEAITVKAGGKVVFVNVEKRTSHSVWFKADGRAESQRFFPDEIYEQPADLAPGDHDYVCGPHPWMRGRVTVEGAKP